MKRIATKAEKRELLHRKQKEHMASLSDQLKRKQPRTRITPVHVVKKG